MRHIDRPAAHPAILTRRGLVSAVAAAASLFALSACASDAWPYRGPGGLASIEVFDRDSGQVVPTYRKDGRQFVPGRPGARYALRLRNLTPARVLVVLSVDGVNVISGETADWRQVGYVLDPGRSADINGWRKSGTEVAAFEFAPIERSYAAQTGRPDHVGVIGLAAFRERFVPPPPAAPPIAARSESRAADAAEPNAQGAAMPSSEKSAAADAASARLGRLGTGHGQREWSVSRHTSFERATSSAEQLTQLEYDSHERLVAAGVIADPTAYARPRPFPSNQPGFVPDPPAR
jgi:hypothetical protein